jgi:heme exporter protein A
MQKVNKIELACENLEMSFSNKLIFKKLSFKLTNSSSLIITGRNGTGKSTLIKILSNLIKETNGKKWMKLNGEYVERDKQFFNIGLLAPYINLYDELTSYENLEFFYKLKINRHKEKGIEEKIKQLLEKVNLYKKRNDLVKNYSSGMKQRLKIAFAILSDPLILLMDEPGTNLDKDGIGIIYNIAEKQKKNGILIIATNENEDTKLCDKRINIEDYKGIQNII